METIYDLEIQIRLQAKNKDGSYSHGGSLEIRENETITADTFLEVAGILGQFHELTRVIKAKK
jgi:hypothetical protein